MRYSLTVLHSLTCLTLLSWILPFLLTQGAAADQPIEPDLPPLTSEQDLTQLSLEELMNMEVTSVSKKPQKLSQAQAAIHVLSGEDIRRMGITTIPDALRLVPGLQVARIDSNKWAVSARGFNDRFANKLLVLIDGRSVYTPLFAGVYWEAQMVPLQDIDRIEVIRGPGGTLWGANAVNGVINIITKSTQDTQGAMASVTYGNEERGLGTLRYGGKAGDALAYRLYGQFMSRDSAFQEGGAHDDWQLGQGGLRTDWQPDTNDTVTVQGDYYQGTAGQRITTPVPADAAPLAPANLTTVNEDVKLRGGNILFRWHRLLSDKEDFTLQAYFDHVGREEASLYEDRQTIDLELQHHIPWLAHHDVLWGIGYRLTRDETRG
ncbi:MAG: TonB-dependent receptor plug domain-containing protein, partial [Nitrospira sp.]|nr:TonB-dependent receptor plug domain-containing protein [Nitrospira sp.]MCA9481779.1 TonB-dependent receptor plug domain-containing protein [Nitrospira sp.]